jgi:hypothetical protein
MPSTAAPVKESAASMPTATPALARAVTPAAVLNNTQSAARAAYQGGPGRLYNYSVPATATASPIPTPSTTPVAATDAAPVPAAPARPSFDIGLFTGILLLLFACGCWFVVQRGSRQRQRSE